MVLILLFASFVGVGISGQTALPIHSHNDYDRDRPLDEALEARARSIEADVFPGDGKLLVAHDRHEIRAGRTLSAMYLRPLAERIDRLGGVYEGQPEDEPVILLVDFKGDAERSMELLVEATRPMADHLARPGEDGRVRGRLMVVVSGNTPRGTILERSPRDIFVDGRLPDLKERGLDAGGAPLVSSRWSDSFRWRGQGEMPAGERARLTEVVAAAHEQGHLIRFWASPDTPEGWATLHRAGVDLINTDMPGAVAAALGGGRSGLRLPTVLADGMVLQQQTEATLWGWAAPGERVEVSASWGASASAAADDDGRWRAGIATPEASNTPHSISIRSGDEIVLSDVLVGEVWVCSGQSNMEWPLSRSAGGIEEAKAASHPWLRFFQVRNTSEPEPAEDVSGRWVTCTPESAGDLSGVAYWFSQRVREHTGVPIGLIQADWGGTRVESWMPESSLRGLGGFDRELDALREHAELARSVGDFDAYVDRWYRGIAATPAPTDGSGTAWIAPELDDSGWERIRAPGRWEDQSGPFDGIAWYRRVFEVPAQRAGEWAGEPGAIEFGGIDDCDTVWLNGELIGETMGPGRWREHRSYEVPRGLYRAGRNVVVVRVLDTYSSGGIRGDAKALRAVGAGGQTLPLEGEWLFKTERALDELPTWPFASRGRNVVTSLYNGMIAPVTPMTIRGVIWYQGESNRHSPGNYEELFTAMIGAWRAAFGNERLPFYFVQIAPFSDKTGGTRIIQMAQTRAWRSTPNTGMVTTMDIGDPDDIHPRNKRGVGHRLAQWALAETYNVGGSPLASPAPPTLASASIEGRRVRLSFRDGDGLHAVGGPARCLTIAGSDGRFVPAQAVIEGSELVVWSVEVPNPVAVRHAWKSGDVPNVFSGTGLPIMPFDSRSPNAR